VTDRTGYPHQGLGADILMRRITLMRRYEP
jgi:hypothetical protein